MMCMKYFICLASFAMILTSATAQTKKSDPATDSTKRKELAAVTITGKRAPVEQKIDRTIVNVEALISNTGTTALDVLENSPGITVDKEGDISLKGKEGVMILVDGRPTHLSGPDLANMLRNMASSQMDQVEIMTNPPAKYDASGT